MPQIDETARRASFRFVWMGSRGAGRGTNIRQLHTAFPAEIRSRLKAVEIRGDRTLSLKLDLPVEDWVIELHLAALTGDIRSSETMKKGLENADAIIFVAHAGRSRTLTNKEAFRELMEYLRLREAAQGIPIPPGVIQVNHTDAEDALDTEELMREWEETGWPLFTSQAKMGDGVRETLSSVFQIAYQAACAENPVLEKAGLYLDAVAGALIAAMRKNP